MASTQPPNNLPPHSRFITTHDSSGKAIFSSSVPEPLEDRQLGKTNALTSLIFTTKGLPVSTASDADIDTYKNYLTSPPGLTEENTTIFRTVDFAPDTPALMHRTESVDLGIVLEGEVELELDSGEKKILKRGDVAIQRVTNHAWRNTSETEWARLLFVLQPAEKVVIGGKELSQDLSSVPN